MASTITYLLCGFITILLTYTKPTAYWNNASRKFFRPLIGDQATAWLHYMVGAGLVAIGVVLMHSEALV